MTPAHKPAQDQASVSPETPEVDAWDGVMYDNIFGPPDPTPAEQEAMRAADAAKAREGICDKCDQPLDSFGHNKLVAKRQGAHARDAARKAVA